MKSYSPIGTGTLSFNHTNSQQSGGLPTNWIDFGGVVPQYVATISPNTTYRVTVEGQVSVSPNPAHQLKWPGTSYPSTGSYGPDGTGGLSNELRTYVEFRWPSGERSVIGTSTYGATVKTGLVTTATGGEIWVGSAGMWNQTQADGFYMMSGTRTVTVEKATAALQLKATPSRVKKGGTVTFAASTDDPTLAISTIHNWQWTDPAIPKVYNNAYPCTNYNPTCVAQIFTTGSMMIHASASGSDFMATAGVVVYSSFTLDASTTSARTGDTVIFTPRFDGQPGPVTGWKWVPDSTGTADLAGCAAGTTECRKVMQRSGTMWAYSGPDSASKHVTVTRRVLTLESNRVSVAPGDPVTFTAKLDGIVSPAHRWTWRPDSGAAQPEICAANTAQCVTNPTTTGYMWAYFEGDSVRKRVLVVPCPQNDSIVDDPAIRKKFGEMWDLSRPDSNQSERVERSARIYDSAGTKKLVILTNDANSGPCETNGLLPKGENVTGWTEIAIAHTHPFKDNEVYRDSRCPNGGPNNKTWGYAYSPTGGWGSPTDWYWSNTLQVPGYIIDANRITRINGPGATVGPLFDHNGNRIEGYDVRNWKKHHKEMRRTSTCTLFAMTPEFENSSLAGITRLGASMWTMGRGSALSFTFARG